MRLGGIAAALCAALLATGCSSAQRAVEDAVEAVGVPAGCVQLRETGIELVRHVGALQDEGLDRSDVLFDLADAVSAMDADAVESILLAQAEQSRELDTAAARDWAERFRDGVRDCRSS